MERDERWVWNFRLNFFQTFRVKIKRNQTKLLHTSWSTDGKVPPSLNRPHPVTVAFSPMRRSSEPGKHMGTICCVYFTGESSRTMAKSYSYVKKLYFGWTIFRTTERSTNGYGSWSVEKSYSPILMRICDVSKLKIVHRLDKAFRCCRFLHISSFFLCFLLTRQRNDRPSLSSSRSAELLRIGACSKTRRTRSFAPKPVQRTTLVIVKIMRDNKIYWIRKIGLWSWFCTYCGSRWNVYWVEQV